MLYHQNEHVTPFKLLQRPSTHITKASLSLPLRQWIIPKSKTPKLFSSMRAPSVQIRSKKQKTQNPNLPSFLTEYLSDPLYTSKPTTHKALTESKLYRKKILKAEKKAEKFVVTSPKPAQFEIIDSRKILSGALYKPYILKISPRSKIRLFSPSPIGLGSRSHGEAKRKTRKSEFYTIGDTEGKKDYEIQAVKVHVDSYSKDYAEKLRKVLEIKEQARMEVERI